MKATDIAAIMETRQHLKRMLVMARQLNDSPVKTATIEKIEVELLYLKLYVNAAY